MSAALGTPYPAPKSQSADGSLTCNYSDSSTAANAVVGITKVASLTTAEVKESADSQAAAQNLKAAPLAGFGDGAYIIHFNDASTNASGIATTIILIESGSYLIDVTAEATPAHAEALAHLVLSP